MQGLVNKLKRIPQYQRYVTEHKLKLIDSRLAPIDALLDHGDIKA